MSLSVIEAAGEAPDRVALVTDGRAWTFAGLVPPVRAVMRWLSAQGLEPGDTPPLVAVVGANRLETLVAIYALLELGIPMVMIHPRLTRIERQRLIDDARPALLIDERFTLPGGDADGEGGLEASPSSSIPLERPLAILYTSGTSGRPKGAVLSRGAFLASARASARNLGWQEEDRWLLSLPVAHVGGLSILTRCLSGRRCVVLSQPGSDLAEAIWRDRVTLLSVVPTQLKRLLERTPAWMPPAHLRAVLLGGAAASPVLLGEAVDRGVPVLTTYGLTEACSQVTTQRYGSSNRGEQGAGEPVDGVEVRVVDQSIQVRGSSLMAGYFPPGAHPWPFLPGGWFPTGDLGEIDGAGRLHVFARRSDLIVTGGENVYPVEVEQVLEACPGIAAACVFGVADETWGQVVAVALVAGSQAPGREAIARFCSSRLAPFKRPRRIAWLPAMPLNGAGKLDRRAAAAAATTLLEQLYEGEGAGGTPPRE